MQIAENTLQTSPSLAIGALPGLMRYGVPEPEAAWLMGFGITTRTLAISVAIEYSKRGGTSDPSELRAWLTGQDPLQLASSAGVSSDVLAELASVLERTRRPQLSADLRSRPLLPRSGFVSLLNEPTAALTASGLSEGHSVELVRDYETTLDRNRIVVLLNGAELGPLDRATSAVLAVELDAGLGVDARFTELLQDADGPILKLTLTSAEDPLSDAGS